MDVATVAADLRAEQNSLDALVAPLTEEQWRLPTPSPGWTITDQIAHLAYFDRAAAIAISTPMASPVSSESWRAQRAEERRPSRP